MKDIKKSADSSFGENEELRIGVERAFYALYFRLDGTSDGRA